MKNRLKVFRAMHDLTQESLADRLGVTRQTIVSIENGKYDPSIGLAFRIAKLFNVLTNCRIIIEDKVSPIGTKMASPVIFSAVVRRALIEA